MVTRGTTGETIDVIVQRAQFLERLLDDPAEKRTLVEQLEVSRSTVDRALRDLEVEGLVTYADEGYALTAVGEILATRYFAFRDATATHRMVVEADAGNAVEWAEERFGAYRQQARPFQQWVETTTPTRRRTGGR